MFCNVSFSLVTWNDPGFTLTECKLFIKIFLHDPHNFFLLKVLSSVRTKIWTHKRNLMLTCFWNTLSDTNYSGREVSLRCFNKKYKSSSCGRLFLVVKLNFLFEEKDADKRNARSRLEILRQGKVKNNVKKGCRILVRTVLLVYCILCTNISRISFPPQSYPCLKTKAV